VKYESRGPNWTLPVIDNGIGMPSGPDDGKPGLGTNIVEALAKRLDGEVQVVGADPGTAVSIVHEQAAAVATARDV
jgi:two-component sensor histidine kinase